jgi:hypothetical protein
MDTSSEMIHALLPVFLVSTLGASALAVGWIEGVAEATASVAKLFSGAISDAWGRRKPLVALGYGLAAATKPLFPLATAPLHVLVARFVDRVGKGIRGAPRDALIGDLTPPALRGASYGLRQALDTFGAVAGPLLAVGLMAATGGDIRAVFWLASIPALAAVALVLLGVEDVAAEPGPRRLRSPIQRAELRALGAPFLAILGVAALCGLARFSEAFLVLRAADAGLSATLVPFTLVAMNAAYTASSYPAARSPTGRTAACSSCSASWSSRRATSCSHSGPGSRRCSPASPSGASTWGSRRACWQRSWQTRHRPRRAARRSACFT